MKNEYPKFIIEFEQNYNNGEKLPYIMGIERIINHVVPPHFFYADGGACQFLKQLPIVSWSPFRPLPFNLSLFLISRFRPNAFRFFYEMINRWLLPGKKLNALLQFAIDFYIKDFEDQKFICGEVIVRIETPHEFAAIEKNLPILESEIRLGVDSPYQASRILEIKGLTADEKTTSIQENIVSLIHHRPQDFDYDILCDMQHFLVTCKEGFKSERAFKHMSRIICVHYLFRKALQFSLEIYPDRRYISVKLIRAKLPQQKRVLGIALGVSFIRENEIFEESHILNGIKTIVPNAVSVVGSFFINKTRTDGPCTIYLEVEKEGSAIFSLQEERRLKERLPYELKARIAQRLNPIFMPQNEEEIMRHILTLSSQLKYIRDLPQVIIDFKLHQTEEALEFVVVLLRAVHSKSPLISTLFKMKETILEYIPDRTKMKHHLQGIDGERTCFILSH